MHPADGTDGTEMRRELWLEANTMALYVAICLLAALAAVGHDDDGHQVRALALVWGTTVGLALAHLFAFRLSARLVAEGELEPWPIRVSLAQLAGAMAVAVAMTVPILVFPASAEFDVARIMLGTFVGWFAYHVGRARGAGVIRSVLYACVVLAVGLSIAIVKNVLGGH